MKAEHHAILWTVSLLLVEGCNLWDDFPWLGEIFETQQNKALQSKSATT